MANQKTAFITGGSHGIGRGIAIVLAEHGYDVAITYNRRQEDAEAVREKVESMGRKCFVYHAALNDPSVPEPTTERAIADLGHIDLLVCNAGRTITSSILNIDNARIDELFNLNYRAYLLCAATTARHMVRQGIKGNIIFITSSRGDRAYPEDTLYGGFKAGVKRACESIALDLSPYGIRVNCVAPGATTINAVDDAPESRLDQFIPLGRVGTPRGIGEAIAFLASPNASYITGVTLRIDGGLVLPGMPESMPDTTRWLNPNWHKRQRDIMDEEHPE